MVDPFTALGAASSIVQFVDFSSKLVSSGYEAYKSVSGASEENVQLETVTLDLQSFSERLLVTCKRENVTDDPDETAMISVARQCLELASRLIETLDSLKVSGEVSLRSLAAVRQAIHSALKFEEGTGHGQSTSEDPETARLTLVENYKASH